MDEECTKIKKQYDTQYSEMKSKQCPFIDGVPLCLMERCVAYSGSFHCSEKGGYSVEYSHCLRLLDYNLLGILIDALNRVEYNGRTY